MKIVVKLLKKYHIEIDKGRILCLQQNKSGKNIVDLLTVLYTILYTSLNNYKRH